MLCAQYKCLIVVHCIVLVLYRVININITVKQPTEGLPLTQDEAERESTLRYRRNEAQDCTTGGTQTHQTPERRVTFNYNINPCTAILYPVLFKVT